MSTQKRLRSLEDLKELLPASAVQQSGSGVTKQGSRHDGKGRTVHLRLETGGRKGKAVTVITGLTLDVQSMERLARDLKQHCGAGGTVAGRAVFAGAPASTWRTKASVCASSSSRCLIHDVM